MKKIILSLAAATLLFSCKEETNEKVKDATKAVTTDVKQSIDSVTEKAKKRLTPPKLSEKQKTLLLKVPKK